MIVNVWNEPPPQSCCLLDLARERGWTNLPVVAHDVKVHWLQESSPAPSGVRLERRLPSRQYVASAPTFESLVEALAWEAGEWVAIEAWRAQRRRASVGNPNGPSR